MIHIRPGQLHTSPMEAIGQHGKSCSLEVEVTKVRIYLVIYLFLYHILCFTPFGKEKDHMLVIHTLLAKADKLGKANNNTKKILNNVINSAVEITQAIPTRLELIV